MKMSTPSSQWTGTICSLHFCARSSDPTDFQGCCLSGPCAWQACLVLHHHPRNDCQVHECVLDISSYCLLAPSLLVRILLRIQRPTRWRYLSCSYSGNQLERFLIAYNKSMGRQTTTTEYRTGTAWPGMHLGPSRAGVAVLTAAILYYSRAPSTSP